MHFFARHRENIRQSSMSSRLLWPCLLLAALLLRLRPHLGHGGVGALLLGLLLFCAVAAALGDGRIARLFGMQALAADMHARR